jgi:3-hydroxybutyryl-CoA dehydratase
MFFEDFSIDYLVASSGRTITESDVGEFARLTGDFGALHMSEELARQSPFGRRIAHGALIFSISIGLTVGSGVLDESLVAFYGIDGMHFTRPVFIGDTVTVEKRVRALAGKGRGRGLVTFHTRVLNQDRKLVLVYRDSLLLKTKGEAGLSSGGDVSPTP